MWAAITERTSLKGKDIGKIEIYDNNTVVSVPEHDIDETLAQMKNLKICGNPTVTTLYKSVDGDWKRNNRENRGGYGYKKKRYNDKSISRRKNHYE